MTPKISHVQCRALYVRAVRELCRDRRNAWIFCGSTGVQALAHAALATCAGLLGQALIDDQLASSNALVDPSHPANRPFFLAFVGLVAAAVKTVAAALSSYGQKWIAFQVGNAVRQEITDAIVRQGQPASEATRTHATLVVKLRDVEKGIDEGVLAEARAFAHLIPLLVVLIFLSSALALAAIGMLLPFAFALAAVRGRFRAYHSRASRLAETLHAAVDELVRHLDLWRTYGAAAQVQRALVRTGEEAGRAAARADAVKSALSGINEVLAAAALVCVVLLVEAGSVGLEGGSFIAFAAVFFLMYRPLRDLGDARSAVERAAAALQELQSIGDRWVGNTPTWTAEQPPVLGSVSGSPTPVSTSRTNWELGKLDVEGVYVVRNGANEVGAGTTFSAEPGEVVVLMGPTGSGKTTLLRALLGLEPTVTGVVRYAGRDLSGAAVGPAARPFAWVPQEPAIVTGTLEENVALGIAQEVQHGQGDAELGPLARGTLDQIGAGVLLEKKRGVRVQAGGLELSGGERQWVAIARAVASRLPVLLLDEPTSGLDESSQQRVLEALGALRGQRTIILVTHRPEPLSIADRVVLIGAVPP